MDFYDWLLEKRLSQATASKYNLVIKNKSGKKEVNTVKKI